MTDKPAYDEKAAWGAFKKTAPLIGRLVDGKAGKGNAARQRKKFEKPLVPKDDGRRKRSTGRTAVWNTKLKPDFRAKLFGLANSRGIGVAALLEQIVEEWEASSKRGEQGGGTHGDP
jgi:hypothetical protein